jgi:hypothetical protein
MAKQVVSLRLEVETAEWIRSYAKERGCSQAEVVELGCRALREDARGGVPDLPAVEVPSREEQAANKAALKEARVRVEGGETYADIMRGRQANLNRRSS